VTGTTKIKDHVPVEEYFKLQKRFAHLFKGGKQNAAKLAQLQAIADANIKTYDLLADEEI
ncbi:MAG: pyruvate ferredoxin oxidoreductase, partial [Bdellovibrionales bacterium]